MSNAQFDSIQSAKEIYSIKSAILSKLGSWFCVWEIYPIETGRDQSTKPLLLQTTEGLTGITLST